METITKIETRYPECDRAGIIHHSVYAVWYEAARMDFFEAMGFSFSDMNKLKIDPVMVDLHIQYKASATYPQTLTIKTRLDTYAPRKLRLVYEMYNEAGEIINTAETFHVWAGSGGAYNMEENQPEVYAKIVKAAE